MSKYGLTEERYNQMMKTWHNKLFIKSIVDTWGVDICNKGYVITNFDETEMLKIEAFHAAGEFDDYEAVRKAVADGIKIIPVDELPEDMPKKLRWCGWIDTAENRKKITDYCNSLGQGGIDMLSNLAFDVQKSLIQFIEEVNREGSSCMSRDIEISGSMMIFYDTETWGKFIDTFDILGFDFTTGEPDGEIKTWYIDFEFSDGIR